MLGKIIAVLLLLVVVAGGYWSWTHRAEPAPVAVQETHILMGTTTAAGNYKYVENKPYYTVAVSYPAKTTLVGAADVKARMTIEQALADTIAQFKKDSGLDTMTPEDAATQGLDSERKYALDMEYKTYSAPGYVSYVYTDYEDTMGAHPNTGYRTFVFDTNGNQIALKDLFTGVEYRNKIAAAAQKQVIAQLTARMGADASDAYFSEGLSANDENFSSFYLDGDTIGFLFAPYQVAAYAAGSFDVRMPLKNVK